MQYDFITYDNNGRPKVVFEAKRRSGTSAGWAADFRRNLMAHGTTPPGDLFVIVAPDKIYTWKSEAPADAAPENEIDARPILAPYFKRASTEPEQMDAMAFELLVAWWLQDVARGEQVLDDHLKASGLVEAVAGGRIAREVAA